MEELLAFRTSSSVNVFMERLTREEKRQSEAASASTRDLRLGASLCLPGVVSLKNSVNLNLIYLLFSVCNCIKNLTSFSGIKPLTN